MARRIYLCRLYLRERISTANYFAMCRQPCIVPCGGHWWTITNFVSPIGILCRRRVSGNCWLSTPQRLGLAEPILVDQPFLSGPPRLSLGQGHFPDLPATKRPHWYTFAQKCAKSDIPKWESAENAPFLGQSHASKWFEATAQCIDLRPSIFLQHLARSHWTVSSFSPEQGVPTDQAWANSWVKMVSSGA